MSASNEQIFKNGFKVGMNWLLKKGPFAEAAQKLLNAAAYIRAGLDDQSTSKKAGIPLEAVEQLRKLLESAKPLVTH